MSLNSTIDYCQSSSLILLMDYRAEPTIDIHKSSSMADESFRSRKEVVKTDAQPDFLDDFVCVFGIDVVFYSELCVFLEVLRSNLDKVRDFGLYLSDIYSLYLES